MRLMTRDLPLVPLLLPVIAIGLFPLVMLPLLGFLGFVVLGDADRLRRHHGRARGAAGRTPTR